MSHCTHALDYSAGTPGADSSTYTLFDSTAVRVFKGQLQPRGFRRYLLSLKTSHVGTVKGYVSSDGGTTWIQFYNRVILATEATKLRDISVRIDQHRDVKFEWVNGGSAQTTFYVAQALTSDVDHPIDHGYDDPLYIVSGSMVHSVTTTGSAIQVGPEGRLVATIQWASTGTAVGTLSLEFTLDGTNWKPVPFASAEFTTQPNNNNGDLVCYWRELQPFKRVRLKYVSTSGGTANTSLNAQISTR